jgi:RNA polymerase sigma-70 factor (ECF subfamily)
MRGAPNETPADGALVGRAKAGDLAAFEALVRRHHAGAWRVARQIVRDREDALDIAQEAFLRAYRALPRFRERASFRTWLYRIVINLSFDQLASRRGGAVAVEPGRLERPPAGPGGGEWDDDPSRSIERQEARARVHAALAALPEHHRMVLVLRELEGLSYEEIARAVGCSIGTVMSRLHHGRQRLRALLEQGA